MLRRALRVPVARANHQDAPVPRRGEVGPVVVLLRSLTRRGSADDSARGRARSCFAGDGPPGGACHHAVGAAQGPRIGVTSGWCGSLRRARRVTAVREMGVDAPREQPRECRPQAHAHEDAPLHRRLLTDCPSRQPACSPAWAQSLTFHVWRHTSPFPATTSQCSSQHDCSVGPSWPTPASRSPFARVTRRAEAPVRSPLQRAAPRPASCACVPPAAHASHRARRALKRPAKRCQRADSGRPRGPGRAMAERLRRPRGDGCWRCAAGTGGPGTARRCWGCCAVRSPISSATWFASRWRCGRAGHLAHVVRRAL